jgi:mannitol/fructose-specific phosphotransferase system IIA component (Ntr-type)
VNLQTTSSAGKILTLADFTSEALIIPGLKSRDMSGTIAELSQAFSRTDSRWDTQRLNAAALQREQQMTTAMEFGAAFPHVRSDACIRMQFAFGRAAEPFTWGRDGSLEVRFVFLNAIPASEALGYLRLVSAMARLGKETALCEQFKAATTAAELLKLFSQITVRK